MNKQSTIKADTVADELARLDEQRSKNLRIWSQLSRTDPNHTKGFKRGGGFSGTAIKPIWITQRLTELFGPCGKGWGFERPEFQPMPAGEDILVYCVATAWYMDEGKQHFVYGVGGDVVRGKNKYGPYTDDEAFKKAFTDALGNAFKFVGVGADVHMGLFEDSKYLAEVTAEFTPKQDGITTGEPKVNKRVVLDGPFTSPSTLKAAAKEFVRTLEGCGDEDELLAFLDTEDAKAFMAQLERDMPSWWSGGPDMPGEFIPLEIRVANRKRELAELETIRR